MWVHVLCMVSDMFVVKFKCRTLSLVSYAFSQSQAVVSIVDLTLSFDLSIICRPPMPITMVRTHRARAVPIADQIVGSEFFLAWRYFCQWFLRLDENDQTQRQNEWQQLERQTLVRPMTFHHSIARQVVGLNMFDIFRDEHQEKLFEEQRAKRHEELLQFQQAKTESDARCKAHKAESEARWKLRDPEGWRRDQDEKADNAWSKKLEEATGAEEKKRALWKAKKLFQSAQEEEEKEAAAKDAEEVCKPSPKKRACRAKKAARPPAVFVMSECGKVATKVDKAEEKPQVKSSTQGDNGEEKHKDKKHKEKKDQKDKDKKDKNQKKHKKDKTKEKEEKKDKECPSVQ